MVNPRKFRERMPEQAVFLLVDDSEDDVLLMRRALLIANVINPLHVVKSGEEAIDYLSGEASYGNRQEFPIPSIILLDLKLPGKSGFDVLKWIRKQAALRAVRVIVLTSSNDIRDVGQAYELGANSFIVKPVAFDQLVAATAALKGYWLRLDRAVEAVKIAQTQSSPRKIKEEAG